MSGISDSFKAEVMFDVVVTVLGICTVGTKFKAYYITDEESG
jgi:hypothetical protein